MSPHSSVRSAVDVRDRPFPPVGLIVDGAVADAMGIPFRIESKGEVSVAHTFSAGGVGVVIVRRSRPYSLDGQTTFDRTVETLAVHGVRQVIALSHRLLKAPDDERYANHVDGLTVGVLAYGACTRLLSGAFDRTEDDAFVDGLFLREPQDDNCATLLHEAQLARTNGFCVCLIEATTLRSTAVSRESEHRLAEILMHIPDAVSPLGACYCQNINANRRHD